MATPAVTPDIEAEQKTFKTLSKPAQAGLQKLLQSCLNDDKVARRSEVKEAWRLRLYCQGKQNVWYDQNNYIFCTLEASGRKLPRHRGVYDITSPHKRSFVSILSENPPGVNFVPDDLQRSVDVTAAKLAEKMRGKVDRMVAMKERQSKAAGYLCTDGRVVSWTRVEGDKLVISMHGVLESKVPIYIEDPDGWDYAVLSKETNIWKAKAENPDFEDDISASTDTTAEAMYERYARIGVVATALGGYSDYFKNLVTEHNAWIRTWRFDKLSDEVADELKSAFPSGVHLRSFGDTIVDAVDEDMSALAVEHPVDGEGQTRPALLSGLPDIQNAYNDIKNQMRTNADYGIPAGWFNADVLDSEAFEEQVSAPGVWHGMSLGTGQDIRQHIMQETPAELPQTTVTFLSDLKGDAEFTTGDFPALYGGDTPGQDTVGVNRLLNNQAKGQLGPAWAAIQRLWAKIYPHAIILVAQLQPGITAISGDHGQESFDPAQILDGKFNCYPDQDSSFPETTADKRAALDQLVTRISGAGEAGTAILMAPDNLKLFSQLGGVPDFIIPGAQARDKQLREIEEMLQQGPVPDPAQMQQYQQAAMASIQQGQQPGPPPMTSSVPIDPVWDYHQAERDKVQEWLSSDARFEEERKGNTQGVANVRLHGALHQAQIDKLAQQNAPKPEPPKISLTAQVTDPNAISQLLGEAGIQAAPEDIAASQVPEQQKTAAETQNQAASAFHKSALAAREIVPEHKPAPKPSALPNSGGLK